MLRRLLAGCLDWSTRLEELDLIRLVLGWLSSGGNAGGKKIIDENAKLSDFLRFRAEDTDDRFIVIACVCKFCLSGLRVKFV